MPLVSSGVEHGNLRELALARMSDLGTQCRDVRTREVGIQEIHHKVMPDQVSSRQPSSFAAKSVLSWLCNFHICKTVNSKSLWYSSLMLYDFSVSLL